MINIIIATFKNESNVEQTNFKIFFNITNQFYEILYSIKKFEKTINEKMLTIIVAKISKKNVRKFKKLIKLKKMMISIIKTILIFLLK